jgi:DNA-binding transcriptional regulator of glucitol operon
MSNGAIIIIALVFAWVLQLGLSLWQMRRFYRRMGVLRKDGRAAIGLEGSTWKGRAYTVLVIDEQDIIKHAEKLTGITVFATLRPVPALVGQPLNIFRQEEIDLPVSKKVLASFRKAAESFFEEDEKEQLPDA